MGSSMRRDVMWDGNQDFRTSILSLYFTLNDIVRTFLIGLSDIQCTFAFLIYLSFFVVVFCLLSKLLWKYFNSWIPIFVDYRRNTILWVLEFMVIKFSVYTQVEISFSLVTKFCGLAYLRNPQTVILSQYHWYCIMIYFLWCL